MFLFFSSFCKNPIHFFISLQVLWKVIVFWCRFLYLVSEVDYTFIRIQNKTPMWANRIELIVYSMKGLSPKFQLWSWITGVGSVCKFLSFINLPSPVIYFLFKCFDSFFFYLFRVFCFLDFFSSHFPLLIRFCITDSVSGSSGNKESPLSRNWRVDTTGLES